MNVMVRVKMLMPFRNHPTEAVTEMPYDEALVFTEAGIVEIIEDPAEAADEIVGHVEKIDYEPPAVVEPEPVVEEIDDEPEPDSDYVVEYVEDDDTVSSYTYEDDVDEE